MSRRPRVQSRWSESDALALIAEQERSGLSVWRFAEERGFVAERLYRWRRKLRREGASVEFVEVAARVRQTPIEIALRGGHRILVRGPIDADTLRTVVVALESEC